MFYFYLFRHSLFPFILFLLYLLLFSFSLHLFISFLFYFLFIFSFLNIFCSFRMAFVIYFCFYLFFYFTYILLLQDDICYFVEDDSRYWMGMEKTASDRFLVVGVESKETSENHIIDLNNIKGRCPIYLNFIIFSLFNFFNS